MMNFRDFHDLLEVVSWLRPKTENPAANMLDVASASQVILKAAQTTFGLLPNADVKLMNNDVFHTPGGSATIEVRTQRREINLNLNQPRSGFGKTRPVVMEIEFSWLYKQAPAVTSPKDDSEIYPVSQQLDSETMPALKAFKQFLLLTRQHPIVITFTAVADRPGNVPSQNNRRENLYSKILQSCGYKEVQAGVWLPPGVTL